MRWNALRKLKMPAIVTAGLLVSGLSGAVLFNGVAHGEWDLPGLQQQVQYLTEKTDNHEQRLTNVEQKQDTPSDQPAPTPVVVTQVVTQPAVQGITATPAPAAAPEAAPEATPFPPYVMTFSLVPASSGCAGAPYYQLEWSSGSKTQQAEKPSSGQDRSGYQSVVCSKL